MNEEHQQRRRERALRTLTFWLRPAFTLRVVSRFQRMAGFDRAVALGSAALTALIPMVLLFSAMLPTGDDRSAAGHLIDRYHLSGAGADAVRTALSPPSGESTSVTVVGVVLFVFAAMSFSRAVQRMLEQAWDLKPSGVKNSVNGALWVLGLLAYLALSTWIHHLVRTLGIGVAAVILVAPISALLLLWTGYTLTARRLTLRQLWPFAVIGALAIAGAVTAGSIYLPHLFNSYAERYGVAGAVLAMISALFALMLVIVLATALGREVAEELDRIGRGERPPDDEIQQEWQVVITQARSRLDEARIGAAALRARLRRDR